VSRHPGRLLPLPGSWWAPARALSGRGLGEGLFALAVLGVVLLLATPLSPAALDSLVSLDLAAAAAVLAVSLLAREPLRFASFPTLLLLTTLFRVALNVASTRLILSRGDAGRVIEAFGRVVVQGNVVVGAVVFAIVTLVQLLVVAKGAERVAEVAARFTLDALPGKQMSIDADLRSGALGPAEARQRRRALERESQLYGAMDGALKFVKGDAIAGVVIVLVNVVGGLAAGLLRGMPVARAAARYTVLAIGDGLASQLASLLVAVAAGVAVTRVAAEDGEAGLGGEIWRQLRAEPAALVAAALLLLALALAPGMPAPPLLLAASVPGIAALLALRARREPPGRRVAGEEPPPAEERFAPPSPIALELGPELLAAAAEADLAGRGIAGLRAELWRAMGVRLPAVAVHPSGERSGAGFRLVLDGIPVHQGSLPSSERLVLAPPEDLVLVGIEVRPSDDPLSGRPSALVSALDQPRAAALGRVLGPLERLLAELAGALRQHAHDLVGVQEVQHLLDGIEPTAPALVREVSRLVPPALLAEVLRRLLEEGVSIRPLRVILEAVLRAGGPAHPPSVLAEACRRALRRQLGHAHAAGGTLTVLLLDPAAEQDFREALAGEVPALEPQRALALLDALSAELAGQASPPVLLVSPDVRRAVRSLFAPRFPRLPVLAYEELPPELAVRPVGRVGAPG
jgi:type III secretion protein V